MPITFKRLFKIFSIILIICGISQSIAFAQISRNDKTLILLGGGGSDPYPTSFISTILSRTQKESLTILLLPVGYTTLPNALSNSQRADLLRIAEYQRTKIEDSCNKAVAKGVKCDIRLAPIFIRQDAQAPKAADYFTQDLSAILISGYNQAIAMQVIGGTIVEQALYDAYQNGIVIAGLNAGENILSTNMISGYNPDISADKSFQSNSTDFWNSAEKHGLLIGISNAVIDQDIYSQNHFGRLLSAIILPNTPHIGLGVDSETGVVIHNHKVLDNIFGKYNITILDAATYHAADSAYYSTNNNYLSIRNLLFHIIPPGVGSYDLSDRSVTFGSPMPDEITRTFDALSLPLDAGTIIIGGNLISDPNAKPVFQHFVQLCGNEDANILIVAAGFKIQNTAQIVIDSYRSALGVPTHATVITDTTPTISDELLRNATGIILIAQNQENLGNISNQLGFIKDSWLSGMPVMVDDSSAALTGKYFSLMGLAPAEEIDRKYYNQQTFLIGQTNIGNGLGLIDASIEPRLISDNRWGRLFSLAYNQPTKIAIGLSDGAALEITPNGAWNIGSNEIFIVDFRKSSLQAGTNQAFAVINGIMDIFTNGDVVKPEIGRKSGYQSSIASSNQPQSNPSSVTPSPSPVVSITPEPTNQTKKSPASTKSPRPTATPIIVPPDYNPAASDMMIGFATIMILVVVFGVWIKQRKL